ncbi:penicillin amidase [Rhodovulum imhoffii]|uniref:Penicillin amidase n=1 Tax=Rhodovulum imhoffii TaxID=365340 RepID=A0A2T5BTS2_9RHOB|nr:penicillin acylase family protein [Rhodovulum imhoffii]MBK5934099.1 penicillin acylase family protein [Rhodovulum imhoffii]PTN02828.1 penicillin amidase [Rhodovulum imhoffii]
MSKLYRWLVRLFTAAVLLAGLTVTAVYVLASRSVPDYDATYHIAGLSGPVEIVRDTANVPHIFARTDADVFFGLGFAHAQDRLWQMILMRRTVQGSLSEVFGRRTLQIDDLLRRLDLYGAAQDSVAAQDDWTRAALDAYSAGVNAWLAEVNSRALGRGAPEFFLFSNEMAPWQPADSIALVKLLALQLGPHARREILRARVSLALPKERVRDILPDAPGTGRAALPDYAALFPGMVTRQYAQNFPQDPLSPLRDWGLGSASNVFAAAPARAATGGTLLANDPHLELTAPAIWYLARIELASGGVIGGTIPGIPAVLSGRSAQLGWGITSAYMDDSDIFIEKLNPKNPQEVLTPSGYKPLETRGSIIRIKDEPPVTVTLRWSGNGPILPGSHFNLGAVTPEGHVAALAHTIYDRTDTTMTAAMHLMRAGSVEEGLKAGELFIGPAQNLALADQKNIALQLIGRMPERDAAQQSYGRLPVPAWREENLWQGTLPYSANPRFLNPDSGIVGNTNNKTVERPFPLHVSFDWGDTQRIERLSHLMQSREVHTRESFIEAQLDTVSFTARALLPLVGQDLWFTGQPAPRGTAEHRRQRALDLLANWNGEMNEHMPEPVLYAAWMRALQERLVKDELGPLTAEFTRLQPLFIERVFRDMDGASAWCDIVQSSPRETCKDMASLALDDALIWIGENTGGSLESLRWGDLHQARHDHTVLGGVPVLRWFMNVRQSSSGGDNTLMRAATAGTRDAPFANVHGAGYRGVYDFADPDSSVFIIATGQSGHPLSRFYDNLGDLWRRGEYIPMSLDPALARAGNVGITVLTPAGAQRQNTERTQAGMN